jgi:hypothetical protein
VSEVEYTQEIRPTKTVMRGHVVSTKDWDRLKGMVKAMKARKPIFKDIGLFLLGVSVTSRFSLWSQAAQGLGDDRFTVAAWVAFISAGITGLVFTIIGYSQDEGIETSKDQVLVEMERLESTKGRLPIRSQAEQLKFEAREAVRNVKRENPQWFPKTRKN